MSAEFLLCNVRNGWNADVANDGFGVMAGKASSGPSSQYSLMSIWKWTPSSRLAAAEQAYVEAEFERLNLVIERNRMEKHEYQRKLSAAWLRTVDALEILTALRNAEAVQRLNKKAAEKPEPA
jgi:hypothetical protein